MRKIALFLLAVTVILNVSLPVQAQPFAVISKLEAVGLSLTVDSFNDLYGKPDSTDDALLNLDKNARFDLNDITLEGDKISFSGTIAYGAVSKPIAASGKLYKSYKQAEAIRSIVGDLTDQTGNFNVLLFEVYNDTAKDKTLLDKKLRTAPHLKLYLTDHQGNLLLFETGLPSELGKLSVSNSDKIDTTKDFFWFANVIRPYEQKELPTTDALKKSLGLADTSRVSPMAVGSFSDWVGDTTYYTGVYAGIDYVEAWSLPYGSWKALDVKNQSTWTNSFKIAEHVNVNGTTRRNVDNPFKYRNVRLTTAVGAKSTIINAMTDGRLQGKSSGSSLAMKIIEKAWSTALPAAPSLSDITGWVNAIIDAGTDKTITLGSSNIKLNTSPTVVEGLNQKNNYDMFQWTDINGANTGHYLTLQTTVQYESTTNTSAVANGLMKIKWEVYYPSFTLFGSGSKELPFTYNVSNS